MILSAINEMRDDLAKLHITLHPKKMYIQHISKGVKFTGGVVKFDRLYTGKQTLYNFRQCVEELNTIKDKKRYANTACARLNSYLGFCKHTLSYAKRIEIVKMLSAEWYKYIYITGRCQKVVIRQRHKHFEYDTKNLSQNGFRGSQGTDTRQNRHQLRCRAYN